MNYINELNKIEEQRKKIEEQRKKILDSLYNEIENLPQNAKINIINKNCFTIKVSDIIGKPLNPAYYNYKKSYKIVIDNIKNSDNPIDKLKEIISKKAVIVINYNNGYKNSYTMPLDNTVINYLKKLIS